MYCATFPHKLTNNWELVRHAVRQSVKINNGRTCAVQRRHVAARLVPGAADIRLVGAGRVDAGAVRLRPPVDRLTPVVALRRRRRPATTDAVGSRLGRVRGGLRCVVGARRRRLGLAEAAHEVVLEAGRQRPRVGTGNGPHGRHGATSRIDVVSRLDQRPPTTIFNHYRVC